METFSDWSGLPAETKAHFVVLEDFIGGLDGQEVYSDGDGTIDASDAVKATNALAAEIARLQEAKCRALAIADERSKENVELRAEIARLRVRPTEEEVARTMYEEAQSSRVPWDELPTESEHSARKIWIRIARAALAAAPAESGEPGTPLGRLNRVAEFVVARSLCTGLEAKPPELFLMEAYDALSASEPANPTEPAGEYKRLFRDTGPPDTYSVVSASEPAGAPTLAQRITDVTWTTFGGEQLPAELWRRWSDDLLAVLVAGSPSETAEQTAYRFLVGYHNGDHALVDGLRRNADKRWCLALQLCESYLALLQRGKE